MVRGGEADATVKISADDWTVSGELVILNCTADNLLKFS